MTDVRPLDEPAADVAKPPRELNLTWALVLISIAQLMIVLDLSLIHI